MTREQFDRIPDHMLEPDHRRGATLLIDWLRDRGWSMTLLELSNERHRRGITHNRRTR